ncbi:hypothetical protein [Candidatus Hodarchaeum mangrovi]
MSYIEKAFWDYLKSTLFSGVRILISRRFILFSLILFITSIITTGVVVFEGQDIPFISLLTVDFVFLLQISIAIGFIISGLLSKKLNLILRFLILLITVLIVQILYYLSQDNNTFQFVSELLTQAFPLFAFLSWAFLAPLATFAFTKGMMSNKLTGSILFLGKPISERKSIFSGLMSLIAILSLFWNLIMIYIGFTELRFSYLVLGFIGAGVAILIIIVVNGYIYSDDVFNTILGLFFIISLPNQLLIFLSSVSGTESVVSSFDYIFVLFSLLYTAQNISRRVKLKGVVHTTDTKKKIKEDPFRIGRFIGFVGGEGIVLIYLGLYLGFHLIQLQVLSGLASAYELLFGALPLSEVYHDITMAFMVLILLIVMLFYTMQRGKGYWETDIIRFDFLPPYEDLIDYIDKIKRGEVGKKDLALTVGKKAFSVGGIGIFAAAKKFRDLVGRERGKDEN